MNKSGFLFSLAVVAMMVAFSSCEEEEYSVPPQYDSIICLEGNPVAGDTLTLQVRAKSLGSYYYRAKCDWSITGGSLSFLEPPIPVGYYRDFSVNRNTASMTVVDPEQFLPSVRFVPKSAGTYNIEFRMTLNMSMPTKEGYMTYQVGGASVIPGVADPTLKGSVTVRAK
ncbi:MAG: hypothetical protein J6T18_05985 [Bacteroidaceae bacterium]|nr:hypothetical protein [Bacteroidaceae bacterium]MBO7588957.1 hypothetical protein [Bacteroidaceae bacterium]MBP5647387.1 hypothetical protein [Bacteroidaceae bacterium]